MTTIFDSKPHPDERVEWLRAQVEEYLKRHSDGEILREEQEELVVFVRWMEERFQPRGFFDR